ncbi:gamma carbonic anhydrase family protein [Halococcus sp. AFM35]|uniref:gamma carbonic anhydrase family protein n=1 Tax=Halococcus sp. AFM35 TaxID=3421653 RepID=UPI003EB801D4
MIRTFREHTPLVPDSAFISEMAYLVGDVTLGERTSVWPFCCLRGDFEPTTVGDETNVQEFTMLHGADIGSRVSIGHGVVVDEAIVGDETLIGISSAVLGDAVVGSNCIVAAGALVREGQEIPDGHIAYGVPAETQPLTDDHRELISWICDEYLGMMEQYKSHDGLAARDSSPTAPANHGGQSQ